MKERTQCSGGRALVKAHSVKPDPLEPGGDGLVVYRVGATYVFRLWEIKKHDVKGPVSGAINRASKQLASRGNEYLAKLAGPDTVEQRGPLGAFYAAWYLHDIASVDQARERYTPQRQRQAFAVSSHIFDLALQQDDWSAHDQLSLGFAAAIGYRRGGRDPNATAIMNRLRGLIVLDPPVAAHVETLPLEAGLAFLGFQTRSLFNWLGTGSGSSPRWPASRPSGISAARSSGRRS